MARLPALQKGMAGRQAGHQAVAEGHAMQRGETPVLGQAEWVHGAATQASTPVEQVCGRRGGEDEAQVHDVRRPARRDQQSGGAQAGQLRRKGTAGGWRGSSAAGAAAGSCGSAASGRRLCSPQGAPHPSLTLCRAPACRWPSAWATHGCHRPPAARSQRTRRTWTALPAG